MSDGISERNNIPPRRDQKLRAQGSNPTGSQTKSFTPEYCCESDHKIGGTSLNHNVKLSEHEAQTDTSKTLRGKTGLNLKQPLF